MNQDKPSDNPGNPVPPGGETPSAASKNESENIAYPKSELNVEAKALKKTKAKKTSIETLEQFIQFAYAQKGRKVALKQSVEKRLAGQLPLAPEAINGLLSLSAKDPLFAVPRQILLAARDIVGYPALKGSLRAFVRAAMLVHPIFKRLELVAAINNLSESPSVADAIAMTADSEPSLLATPEGTKALKAAQFTELRTNAAYCLALWFTETRGLTVAAVTETLISALWIRSVKRIQDETGRLRAISEVRNLAGIGVVCELFRMQAQERVRAVMLAEKERDRALQEAQSLREELEAFENKASELEHRFDELQKESKREKAAHEAVVTHLRSDLEQQRTRVLRRLKADLGLLDEGLLALRRDPPKVHVMDDHAERVVDSLRQEVGKLETGA